jgi:hypothetical protein
LHAFLSLRTNLELACFQEEEEEQLNLHMHALLYFFFPILFGEFHLQARGVLLPRPCNPERAERTKAVEIVGDRHYAPSSLTGGQDVEDLVEGLLP